MPSWAIHLAVSKELSKEMKKEEKEAFTLGNLLPDVNNGYLIEGVAKIDHDTTHYMIGRNYLELDQIKNLLNDYKELANSMKEELKKPIVYGYFVHILTDYYWNRYTYRDKGVFESGKLIGIRKNDNTIFDGDKEDIRIMKVGDFNKFSKYLYHNCLEKICFTDETLEEQVKQIGIIKVKKNDIEKVNKYFETVEKKLKNVPEKYELFTQEEFERCLKENIEFIRGII